MLSDKDKVSAVVEVCFTVLDLIWSTNDKFRLDFFHFSKGQTHTYHLFQYQNIQKSISFNIRVT
jgi:hypothetical protein